MRPMVQAKLVNDVFGDACLYAELMFERRALLFDLGDVAALSARRLLRVTHVFVSHAHIDHLSGFDRLLRVTLDRGRGITLFGPADFADRIAHKLAGYTWNLVGGSGTPLTLEVIELHADGNLAGARFVSRDGFRRERFAPAPLAPWILLDDGRLRVRAAVLDHRTPCLGFALEEPEQLHVLKPRVEALGFKVGPWLTALKRAVRQGASDDTPFPVVWREGGTRREATMPLGALRAEVLRAAPGQKIAYVVDAVGTAENAARIVDLARGADILFIEASFLDADAALASARYHLTARQAGELARRAGVKRVVPFHVSTRYRGREAEVEAELQEAFRAAAT